MEAGPSPTGKLQAEIRDIVDVHSVVEWIVRIIKNDVVTGERTMHYGRDPSSVSIAA